MGKPNYQFEKRQREQQKMRKKAEKAQRKVQPAPTEPKSDADASVSGISTRLGDA